MQLKDYIDLVEFLKVIASEKSDERDEWQRYLDKTENRQLCEDMIGKYSLQATEAYRLIRLITEGEVTLR